MSHIHVDHPGEWRWWPNRGPAPVIGRCPHVCAHESQQVIAWGPDVKHYELVQCDAVCAGTCRAWTDGTARTTTPWQQVAVTEPAPRRPAPARPSAPAQARSTQRDEPAAPARGVGPFP